jgi:FAD/FMN-containing dehydrogenase
MGSTDLAGAIGRLRETFAGEVVVPNDPGYDDARKVWNGMIDRRPALVVRPTGVDDVVSAVRFGRENGLVLAIRGGGHSMAGYSTCDGGLVVDLSRMRGVTIDAERRTARVLGGTLLSQLDQAVQAHGLVCPVGVVGHTGVGGLTLGGGMGRLQRKHGLTIDNLRAAELVTADGLLVRASENDNADLFWGLRGAGANFGVVTAFEFELHPFGPTINRGLHVYPATQVHEVWPMFRDWAAGAADDVGLLTFSISLAPRNGEYPDSVAGQPIISIGVYHDGNVADIERVTAPLRSVAPPISGSVKPEPYLAVQTAYDEASAWGHRVYTKGGFANDFRPQAFDELIALVAEAPSENSFGIWAQDGQVGRRSEDATAFTGRSALFNMSGESDWDDPALDEANISWARKAMAIVEPDAVTGRYVNDVSESGLELGRTIYGDAKFERLVALKRAWDPDNAFRLNQNIRP